MFCFNVFILPEFQDFSFHVFMQPLCQFIAPPHQYFYQQIDLLAWPEHYAPRLLIGSFQHPHFLFIFFILCNIPCVSDLGRSGASPFVLVPLLASGLIRLVSCATSFTTVHDWVLQQSCEICLKVQIYQTVQIMIQIKHHFWKFIRAQQSAIMVIHLL